MVVGREKFKLIQQDSAYFRVVYAFEAFQYVSEMTFDCGLLFVWGTEE